jgi:hypothetical protein
VITTSEAALTVEVQRLRRALRDQQRATLDFVQSVYDRLGDKMDSRHLYPKGLRQLSQAFIIFALPCFSPLPLRLNTPWCPTLDFPGDSLGSAWHLRLSPGKPSDSDDFLPK